MKILAIETSCDETAAAVVEEGKHILSNVVASSAPMHRKYGGIVPEIAAREQLACIIPTITEALNQANTSVSGVDAIAVTIGPGLIGSLLIGVESAKTMALVEHKPLIPVNHVIAHMYANFLKGSQSSAISIGQETKKQKADSRKLIAFPAISLVVSGGHTELFLMESEKKLKWLGGTLDDAAGEAFDKTARLLGFGTGGGPAIQEAAYQFTINNHPLTIHLPRPMAYDQSLNFSFSGLKTAVLREYQKLQNFHYDNTYHHSKNTSTSLPSDELFELAYEIQEAITDVLVEKTLRAALQYSAQSILVSGGVAANSRLREKFQASINDLPAGTAGQLSAINLHVPPVSLCTDNAVYIAACAYYRGRPTDWHKLTALPDLPVEISD